MACPIPKIWCLLWKSIYYSFTTELHLIDSSIGPIIKWLLSCIHLIENVLHKPIKIHTTLSKSFKNNNNHHLFIVLKSHLVQWTLRNKHT